MRLGDLVVLIHKQDLCPVAGLCGVRERIGKDGLWEEKRVGWFLCRLSFFVGRTIKAPKSEKGGRRGRIVESDATETLRSESSAQENAVSVRWVGGRERGEEADKRQIAMFSCGDAKKGRARHRRGTGHRMFVMQREPDCTESWRTRMLCMRSVVAGAKRVRGCEGGFMERRDFAEWEIKGDDGDGTCESI